jgi:hypothetical protein
LLDAGVFLCLLVKGPGAHSDGCFSLCLSCCGVSGSAVMNKPISILSLIRFLMKHLSIKKATYEGHPRPSIFHPNLPKILKVTSPFLGKAV